MKTNNLITLLSPKEIQDFEKIVIKNHKRDSLKKLYLTLKKFPDAEKPLLYEKAFKESYTLEKDSIFRNELRLLNREIELFLIELEWKRQLNIQSDESQLTLIKLYQQKGVLDLFEKNWKKLYKKALAERSYQLQNDLIILYFDFIFKHSEIELSLYQEVENLLKNALAICAAQSMEQYKSIQLKLAFAQRTIHSLSPNSHQFTPEQEYLSLNKSTENEDYLNYLDAYTQSFYVDGLPKIELLEKAHELLTLLIPFSRYEAQSHQLALKASIGLEYYLMRAYGKADLVYNQIIQKIDHLPEERKGIIYFNYFSNILCLENYKKAVDFYESTKQFWKKAPKLYYRIQFMLCWAYIMLNEYEKPLKIILQQDLNQRPEGDFIYARVLLAILYYSKGNYELAEREVYNLAQNGRYKMPLQEVYVDFSKLFYKHIQISYSINKEEIQEKITALQIELDNLFNEGSNATMSSLLYRWFNHQNKILSERNK